MDRRTEKSNASTKALEILLREVAANPEKATAHKDLLSALSTQGGIAKLQIGKLNIRAMSLNTLKRSAEEVVVGGFQALDQLRAECLSKAKPSAVPATSTSERADSRRALQARQRVLVEQLQQSKEDTLFLSERLGLAMQQARVYAAEAGPDAVARCKREQREMLHSLGLRPSVGGINGPRARR